MAATSARPKGGDAKSQAEKRADEKKPWTVKALGLFDRIDVDVRAPSLDLGTAATVCSMLKSAHLRPCLQDSGLIDQEELMAKLRADGQLEELLGTKSLAVDGAAVEKDVKESKTAQRDRLISMLFDEFDVTDNVKGNQATRKQDRMLNRDEFSDLIRLGRIRILFHRMDVDRSGSIEKNEFAAKLQADDELEDLLGLPNVSGTKVYTNMIYTTLFNQYDDNKDGKLSREEFQRLCTEATIQAREEAARQASVAEAAARSKTTKVEAESEGDALPVEVS